LQFLTRPLEFVDAATTTTPARFFLPGDQGGGQIKGDDIFIERFFGVFLSTAQ
jgi:hypothetical protein